MIHVSVKCSFTLPELIKRHHSFISAHFVTSYQALKSRKGRTETALASMYFLHITVAQQSGFSQIRRNANIGIRGFTT